MASRVMEVGFWPVLAMALSVFTMGACGSGDDACDGSEKRICIVPLGNVSDDLVRHLVDYYREEYDLKVRTLDNKSIPTERADPDRKQVGGIALLEYMGSLIPEAYADPDAILVGVTPVDMYLRTEIGASPSGSLTSRLIRA